LVRRKSIVIKDNLIKRGWQGDKQCQLCGRDETIDLIIYSILMPIRISLGCSAAKLVWSIFQCVFCLPTIPDNIHTLLYSWIAKLRTLEKRLIHSGDCCCVLDFVAIEKGYKL
jgi:hypothetical protein